MNSAQAQNVVAVAHGAGGGVEANFAPLFGLPHRFVGPEYPAEGVLELADLADSVVAAGVAAGGGRFPVVGLSLGAAVAVTAAVRHPERVSALVLTVGVSYADAQVRAVSSLWRRLHAAGEWAGLAEFLLLSAGSARQFAQIDDLAGAVAVVRDSYPAGGAVQVELAGRVDVRPLLDQVAVPTLVVVGGRDRIVLPETARGFGAIAGSEVVEYPEAGHIFTPDEAAQWARDVGAFLGRQVPQNV